MKLVKRCVAACSYKNKAGEEKTKWVEVGSLWRKEDGALSLRIDAVPTSNWDGWCLLQDPFENEIAQEEAEQAEASDSGKQELPEDDIPF